MVKLKVVISVSLTQLCSAQAENTALVLVQGAGLWNMPPLTMPYWLLAAAAHFHSTSTHPVEQQKYRYFVSVLAVELHLIKDQVTLLGARKVLRRTELRVACTWL